jgi:hypothetical protein
MNAKTDYDFFDISLKNIRKFKGYCYDIAQGYSEIKNNHSGSPDFRILQEEDHDGNSIFEATSYATTPGHGLAELNQLVQWPLPPEFCEFYEHYEKALAVTRTYPLYLWPEAKIIDEINERREFLDRPLRTFRFGEQYEREATQFGLWLEEPGTMKWRVIGMDNGTIDEMDDPYVEPDRIIGASFYEWFKKWIETDGASDPFMEGMHFKTVP